MNFFRRFNKESNKPEAEIFGGLTQAQINDVHALLEDKFGFDAHEDALDGDRTIFFGRPLTDQEVDEVYDAVLRIAGDKFEVSFHNDHIAIFPTAEQG